MSVLENERNEKFCQFRARGVAQLEAYEKAGYASRRDGASKLEAKSHIRNRIVEIRSELTAAGMAKIAPPAPEDVEAAVSKAWVRSRLRWVIERSMRGKVLLDNKTGSPRVGADGRPLLDGKTDGKTFVDAMRLLCQVDGLIVNRNENGEPGEFERLTDEELEAEARRRAQEFSPGRSVKKH